MKKLQQHKIISFSPICCKQLGISIFQLIFQWNVGFHKTITYCFEYIEQQEDKRYTCRSLFQLFSIQSHLVFQIYIKWDPLEWQYIQYGWPWLFVSGICCELLFVYAILFKMCFGPENLARNRFYSLLSLSLSWHFTFISLSGIRNYDVDVEKSTLPCVSYLQLGKLKLSALVRKS